MAIEITLKWYGDVTRSNTMVKPILQGSVDGRIGVGRLRTKCRENIVEWTRMMRKALRSANYRIVGGGL